MPENNIILYLNHTSIKVNKVINSTQKRRRKYFITRPTLQKMKMKIRFETSENETEMKGYYSSTQSHTKQ